MTLIPLGTGCLDFNYVTSLPFYFRRERISFLRIPVMPDGYSNLKPRQGETVQAA